MKRGEKEMKMYKIFLLITFMLLVALTGCSDNSASGSSSSENAKVLAGILLDADGNAVSNSIISLRGLGGSRIISSDTTGKGGCFTFEILDLLEFTVLSNSQNGSSAYKYYREFSGDTLWDTLVLSLNGSVQISGNAYIDFEKDSILVIGTGYKFPMSNADIDINGEWRITIIDLPAATLPGVAIVSGDSIQELASSLTVFSAESSSVIIKDDKAIHQWNVPVDVSVKQVVLEKFGSLDSMKILINKQLDSASKIITELAELPGVFNFYADSFNVFTGSAFTEGNKSLDDAAHRLLYTDTALNARTIERAGIASRLQYIWLSSASYDFFKQWDLELLVHLLTEGRGAVPLQYQNVDAGTFPLEHDGYVSQASVMNKNSYADFMTDYTRGVLLHNHSNIGNERAILAKAIPETIKIVDTSSSISKLYIFGSAINDSTINTDTLLTINGVPNGNNIIFLLPSDIFFSDANILYGNLMILSDTEKIKWFTLQDASEGWFSGNENEYIIYF